MSTLKLSQLDGDIYGEMSRFLNRKDHGLLADILVAHCRILNVPPKDACMVMAEFINAFCICVCVGDSDPKEALEGLKALHRDQLTNLINDWNDYRGRAEK